MNSPAPRSDPPAAAVRWGFVGAGKMATALVRGMIAAGVAEPSAIVASDPEPAAREALAGAAGIGDAPEQRRGRRRGPTCW